MKKTYKEKYLEQKRENEYLKIILNNLDTDLHNSKSEFKQYKLDLQEKKNKEDKYTFIMLITLFVVFTVTFITLAILRGFQL